MPRRVEGWVRQRAERIDVEHSRRASEVVRPIQMRVGDWQVQAANLGALAQHRSDGGQAISGIVGEAAILLADIREAQRLLGQTSATLPSELVQHSRYQDVVRAVKSAEMAASRIIALGEEKTAATVHSHASLRQPQRSSPHSSKTSSDDAVPRAQTRSTRNTRRGLTHRLPSPVQ